MGVIPHIRFPAFYPAMPLPATPENLNGHHGAIVHVLFKSVDINQSTLQQDYATRESGSTQPQTGATRLRGLQETQGEMRWEFALWSLPVAK